jgi:hypothetical protein
MKIGLAVDLSALADVAPMPPKKGACAPPRM